MSKGVNWRLDWVNHVFPLLLGHAHWPVDPSRGHRTSTLVLPHREVVRQAPECGSIRTAHDSPISLFPALSNLLAQRGHAGTHEHMVPLDIHRGYPQSQISPEHLETHAELWFYSTRLSFPIKLSNVWLNFSQMNHCHHHQHHLCSISCYPRYYQLFFSSANAFHFLNPVFRGIYF